MIDIVTVVFREELPVLKLQAESIDLYAQDIARIYVVVNDDSIDVSEIELSWWGRYREQVTVIHRKSWPIEYAENGWLTQQLLKMLGSTLSSAEYSMVLDAKTILVKPIDFTCMVDSAGRLTWGYGPVYPVFDRAKQIVSELFDIDPNMSVAGPAGVPFFFHNATIKEMIKEVESRTNQEFSSWFQTTGMVTEFILYSGYLQYRDGTLEKTYTNDSPHPYQVCNLCHNEVADFDRKYLEMVKDENLTVSIHRGAWPNLSKSQQKAYVDLLLLRGISQAKDLM